MELHATGSLPAWSPLAVFQREFPEVFEPEPEEVPAETPAEGEGEEEGAGEEAAPPAPEGAGAPAEGEEGEGGGEGADEEPEEEADPDPHGYRARLDAIRKEVRPSPDPENIFSGPHLDAAALRCRGSDAPPPPRTACVAPVSSLLAGHPAHPARTRRGGAVAPPVHPKRTRLNKAPRSRPWPGRRPNPPPRRAQYDDAVKIADDMESYLAERYRQAREAEAQEESANDAEFTPMWRQVRAALAAGAPPRRRASSRAG